MAHREDKASQDRQDHSCPSAPALPGATLLSILGADGRLHNLKSKIAVDAAFLEAAKADGPPETRMRFASRCRTSDCLQWTGDRCGVIDRVMSALGPEVTGTGQGALQPCTIRHDCRWFAQTGREACAACRFVVTDNRNEVAAE